MKDVIVIGSGPAGLTAALYTARANLSTVVITGQQLGGQVSATYEIENYPGFPEPLTGADLVERFTQHAERFGVEMIYDEVIGVDFREPPHRVTTYGGTYEARAVVVAPGASARRLGVPGEQELAGRGVSYCAVCDGAFFKDQDVAVVGGGDSALEEGIFLTRFARSVQVIHRRDAFRAGPAMQARARANAKVSYVLDSVVEAIGGDGKVDRVTVRHVVTGERQDLAVSGVFVFIGHDPNSAVLRDALPLDEHGYVIVDENMATAVPGVFAAGEIMDPRWRQVATSVGQGCAAGLACQRYLGALD
jgi:thioredoxin reductase (NADPH)